MNLSNSSAATASPRRKAISYARWSCRRQGESGRDSKKRQKDALNAALARWNLELDAEFHDDGKSGFHQKHLAEGGAMLQLRQLATAGKLHGKVLVIEDFDRAGRMQTTDAAPLLMDMLNNRVDLVVGQYGGEYFSKETVNANPYLLYRALERKDSLALFCWFASDGVPIIIRKLNARTLRGQFSLRRLQKASQNED